MATPPPDDGLPPGRDKEPPAAAAPDAAPSPESPPDSLSGLLSESLPQGLAEHELDDPDLDDEEGYGITDATIADIGEALAHGDDMLVSAALAALTFADVAELLEKITDDERKLLLDRHADEIDPDAYAQLAPEILKKTLEAMTPGQVAAIISEVDSDDALHLISSLEDDRQAQIIRKLSAKTRLELQEGLSFPEKSAGRLMQREFVAIPQFWTVGKTIDYLRAAADNLPDYFFDIFVVSPQHHIIGEIPLNRIVRSKRSEKIENIAADEFHPIPATMDQEEVAQIFRREDLVSAPVVDEEDRLIGVITIDDVVDVIDEEAQEDILKFAGVGGNDLYRAVFSTTQVRFRWLFVNLLTANLASMVIALFDGTIQKVVALAVLMPIVASMGGNAGTQALAVAVRALATKELSRANALRVVYKEILVGAINGTAFAVLMGGIAYLRFHSVMLGAVIGSAMIINLIVAGLCGISIPLIVQKFGSDPAVSSTVLLTTFTDVVGFLAFLGLASLFLL
jgi:magnesium transporter